MTVIQYNIDFSIQPCTQDDIYYMPKMKLGETKLNTILQYYTTRNGRNYNERTNGWLTQNINYIVIFTKRKKGKIKL